MSSMYPSSDKQRTYETTDTIYFFTSAFEPFDNFSAHQVQIWNIVFPTAEHVFRWKKFEVTEPKLAERIRVAASPWRVKKLSKESTNRRLDWSDIKVAVMTEIIAAKVSQHEDMREMLRARDDKMIIENSPIDDFWGCGANGKGQNHMGKILMEARQRI